MRITKPCLILCFFALALFAEPAAHAAKLRLPPWLAEASKRFPAVPKDTTAVVLHDEAVNTVSSNGRITTVVMRAVRIVTRDGKPYAHIDIPYDSSCEKISGFRAWVIRPDADGKTYSIKDTVDTSFSDALHTELRQICMQAALNDVFEDCIFAFEYTRENRGIFGQTRWRFQDTLPVVLSRVSYALPKGWNIETIPVNYGQIDPSVKESTYTWELRDLPAVKLEPFSPSFSRIIAGLNISLIPPPSGKTPRITFRTWKELSIFDSALQEKPCVPDATVIAKTNELLASAGPSLWNRIHALARYAQSINYMSIEVNMGRGGGWTPRLAPEVLKTGYGDCKDKASLLRAMLSVAGIKSYSVNAYSGDRYYVTEDLLGVAQFNHAIIAIHIDDPAVKSPAIVDHPVFGRLLFFDPTDQFTPLGDLPYDEQGSLVLVLAGEKGELVRLPFTPPSANHLSRAVVAQLTSAGGIAARLTEKSIGQSAVVERAFHRLPSGKYDDRIRNWINGTVHAAKLLKCKVADAQESGEFTLTAEFVAPSYAQPMRDKLLIFKPAIVNRRDLVPPTQLDRKYPVVLGPRSYSESADIYIPSNFAIDELPRAVEAVASFGRYNATCEYDAATRQVRYRRSLTMNAAEIPAKDYASVRQFFETIRKAEQTPVVLSRQQ